jgi:hypothetical protein
VRKALYSGVLHKFFEVLFCLIKLLVLDVMLTRRLPLRRLPRSFVTPIATSLVEAPFEIVGNVKTWPASP